MKSFYIVLTFAIIFTACADKNAFDKFNMLKEQELSATSLQSSKIKRANNIEGTISALYLNAVYPKRYNNNEYFYVYIFQKDKKEMFNPNKLDEIKLTLRLNDKLPIKVKELSNDNQFSHLTSVRSEWQRYFLIAFQKEESNNLSLVLESGQSSSDLLVYQKDEE